MYYLQAFRTPAARKSCYTSPLGPLSKEAAEVKLAAFEKQGLTVKVYTLEEVQVSEKTVSVIKKVIV